MTAPRITQEIVKRTIPFSSTQIYMETITTTVIEHTTLTEIFTETITETKLETYAISSSGALTLVNTNISTKNLTTINKNPTCVFAMGPYGLVAITGRPMMPSISGSVSASGGISSSRPMMPSISGGISSSRPMMPPMSKPTIQTINLGYNPFIVNMM